MYKLPFHAYFSVLLLFAASAPVFPAEKPALLNIKKVSPHILVEMRYATPNNFTKTTLYPAAVCLLCEPAAHRLARVQAQLEKEGLGLKVWDCYRPISVQEKLWEVVPDARYVANPKRGSRHNRGAAVDLTLVDKNGRELPMPTEFDEFSEKAHRTYMDLPAELLKNRKKLQDVMEAEGFIGNPTEWWHFDDPQWMDYDLRNEPLEDPALLTDKKAAPPQTSLPANSRQLVLIISDEWTAAQGALQRYERDGNKWKAVGSSWPVALGKNGMAWGAGLHSINGNGPIKKEGDYKAPAGLFKIGSAYGPSEKAPANVSWPYQTVDENWVCVDDPGSKNYNKVMSAVGKTKDWKSAEQMVRQDDLYKWVINIEHNYDDPVPGYGSCIFFHLWRSGTSPTEGCAAMEEKNILTLLSWLSPSANSVVVLLPKERYTALKESWKLP